MKTFAKKYLSLFINNVLPKSRLLYERNFLQPDEKIQPMIAHIEKSLANAYLGKSKLIPSILDLPGMSNAHNRHFLNNLCSLPDTRYLEIGTWKGSTLISSLYGNKKNIREAIAMDNWNEFNGPQKEFQKNIDSFLSGYPLRFFSINCFSADKTLFKEPINLYYYDGHHSIAAHKRAFTYFNEIFSDVFIAVIDDWNWNTVRMGTFRAFNKLGYRVYYEKAFISRDWWNGLYVAVLKKTYRKNVNTIYQK